MSNQGRLSSGSSSGGLPRVSSQDQPLYWTDDLPVCHLSGVGFSTNQIYREDGFRREEHEFEDTSLHFKIENDMFLYGVFDGHDSSKVSTFAAQRMPAELLFGQLAGSFSEDEIKEVLTQAFVSVEKGFFESIDEAIADKYSLMLQVPDDMDLGQAFQQYPDVMRRAQSRDAEILGGTTAVVALVKRNKLYVANVGCSRALWCGKDADGILRVTQLTVDHDLTNEAELQRLEQLGIDRTKLLAEGKLGAHDYTRTIGDHHIKSSYKDFEVLSTAKSDPVIAVPEICREIDLTNKTGFLILMSDGLYKSYEDATRTEKTNADIAAMVAQEFNVQSTLNGVAQAVVDRVVRKHHDAFMTCSDERKVLCQKRDDITLLVRNFNHPLPNAIGSPTAGSATAMNRTVAPTTPLSVIIPPNSNTTMRSPPPVNRMLMTIQTNSSTLESSATKSSNYSTNDSTQSGEDLRGLFNKQPRNKPGLTLDADGRIEAYVDFSGFYQAIEELSESQRQTFDAEIEPKPTYDTIPEEKETHIGLATDVVTDTGEDQPDAKAGGNIDIYLTLNDGPTSERTQSS